MTMTEIVTALIGAGCEPKAAATLAMAAFDEGRDASRDERYGVTVTNRSAGAIRAARYRKNRKEKQSSAKANDVADGGVESVTMERDASRDGVTKPCDVFFLSSSERGIQESKKVSKKVSKKEHTEPRTRATRLTRDASLSDADRAFALEHGVTNPDALWAEFVDFWIGVPGQRGTKLDWPATWRNRVRAVGSTAKNTRQRGGGFLDLALQIERAGHE